MMGILIRQLRRGGKIPCHNYQDNCQDENFHCYPRRREVDRTRLFTLPWTLPWLARRGQIKAHEVFVLMSKWLIPKQVALLAF